jgi:hypothetical protein
MCCDVIVHRHSRSVGADLLLFLVFEQRVSRLWQSLGAGQRRSGWQRAAQRRRKCGWYAAADRCV